MAERDLDGDGLALAAVVGASNINGSGVFASDPLGAGALVGLWPGRYLWCSPDPEDDDDFDALPAARDDLALRVAPNWYVGALPVGVALMNHSCAPNCEVRGVAVFTAREVGAGEELTHDYERSDGGDLRWWGFDCRCRASSCRVRVGSSSPPTGWGRR